MTCTLPRPRLPAARETKAEGEQQAEASGKHIGDQVPDSGQRVADGITRQEGRRQEGIE